MRWQRVLRFVLIFLAVATAIGVAMSVRKRDVTANKIPVTRIDPKAVAESAKGRLSQMTGMKIPGYLDFDRNLTYDDGSVKFIGPKLTTRRAGREFHLSGKEARVGKEQSNMEVTGDVYLTASDGLKVRTDRATYGSKERIVRAPNLVKFVKGTLRGSGVGMTYDEERDVLWLLKNVKINVAADKKTDDPGATIVSGTAGLARRDRYMRFEGGVSIVRAGRTIEAKSALAYLTDDGNAVKAMELRGDSRISMKDASPGGLQALAAPEMNLGFKPDGETIQRALLAGGGVIQMAGTGDKPGRRIAGKTIDVALGDQNEVTSLAAREQVQLTIPRDQDTPERTIRSVSMDATGEAGKGLTAATFTKDVEFREVRGPDDYREAHSATLAVVLTDSGIDDAQFKGGTRFEDGKSTATAADARYLVSKGRLLLSGNVGTQSPQVQDDRITVDAKAIDMAFEGPKLIATGEVRSVMKPSKKPVGAHRCDWCDRCEGCYRCEKCRECVRCEECSDRATVRKERAKGAGHAERRSAGLRHGAGARLRRREREGDLHRRLAPLAGRHGGDGRKDHHRRIDGRSLRQHQRAHQLHPRAARFEDAAEKTGADDRVLAGHALRGRDPPGDLHDERARQRTAGRSARREDRNVHAGGRQ